jgi:hypothetical protein
VPEELADSMAAKSLSLPASLTEETTELSALSIRAISEL